jgi:ABC-2 type transport system ATP-binding protein
MLSAKNLRKEFATVLAVDDVSLNVQRGSIFGLIGPNGAGKSTTIRMLLNITVPDKGTILYDGRPFSPVIQNSIGYLPEERGLYRKNKLLDTMIYFAGLRGVDRTEAKKRAKDWLSRFDMLSYADRKVEELSKGNQQKIQFIISILHDPALVVLDEPFSGLDPVNQIVLKDIFQDLKQQNKAIIFSTHQMETAEKLCDEICLIDHGKIVVEGSLMNVKRQFGQNSLHVEFNGDGSFLQSHPLVKKAIMYENYAELVLNDSAGSRDILPSLLEHLDVRKFEFVEPSLNSIFLDVVGADETIRHIEQPQGEARRQAAVAGVKADPRVKKAKMTMIVGSLVGLTFIGVELVKPHINWSTPLLMCVVVLFTVFRYLKAVKDVTREFSAVSEKESSHVE